MKFISATQTSSAVPKYAIGDVADFMNGFPDYYENGSYGKFLKTGTWVQGGSIASSVVKKFLAGTNGTLTAASNYGDGVNGQLDIYPNIITSQFNCLPIGTNAYAQYNDGCVRLDTDGVNFTSLAAAGATIGTAFGGAKFSLTNNGTNLFMYFYQGSTIQCRKSTDGGKTFSTQALTGVSTVNPAAAPGGWNVANSGAQGSYLGGFTYSFANGDFIAMWCGARFLIVGANSSNQLVALNSTDGAAFTDNTASILGSTSLTYSTGHSTYVYRNGNNVFLFFGSGNTGRFSSDGGVTWAAVSTLRNSASQAFHQNTTTPAKLVNTTTADQTVFYFSSNSGSSWTTRATPDSNISTGMYIAYAGSVLLFMPRTGAPIWRSADDGVTWAQVALPASVGSNPSAVFHDGYRFIVALSSYQIATSTDGLTWTVSKFPRKRVFSTTTMDKWGKRPIALDATKTVIASCDTNTPNSLNELIYTLDGGATWFLTYVGISSRGAPGYGLAVSNAGFSGFITGGEYASETSQYLKQCIVQTSDLVAGGAWFSSSASVVTPTKSGSVVYAKVGD